MSKISNCGNEHHIYQNGEIFIECTYDMEDHLYKYMASWKDKEGKRPLTGYRVTKPTIPSLERQTLKKYRIRPRKFVNYLNPWI